MGRRFISEAVTPGAEMYDARGLAHGEPAVPISFRWHDETLEVKAICRTWCSTKTDRGESYLKRHWYEAELGDGRIAVFYFDRGARQAAPRWWLYTLKE